MKLSRRVTAIAGIAAAMALPVASQAQATFNYYTTGQFGGACSGAEAVTVQCGPSTTGGVFLSFTGEPAVTAGNYFSPSNLVFGHFTPGGFGSQSVPAGVTFTLFVHQTDPSLGNAATTGSLTGTLTETTAGGQSSLVWTPDSYAFSIGQVNYSITPNVPVAIGFQGNTSINGYGQSTVPEPSSMALLGTGLIGLVPMIRRKRQK